MNAALQAAAEAATDATEMSRFWRDVSPLWRQQKMERSVEVILAALAELEERGWRLLPIEPTETQRKAAIDRPENETVDLYQGIYRAMVAAAPRIQEETL